MANSEIDRNALQLLSTNITGFPHQKSSFFGLCLNPQKLIITAKELHPEQLCAKNVYGAMLIYTPNGPIEIYARNGMTHGSFEQLDQFTNRNLISLTDENTNPRIVNYLRGQRDRLAILSCRDIALQSGCAYCIKDIQFEGLLPSKEEKKSTHMPRNSRLHCPNNIAGGCTERLMLNKWLPYILEFQNQLIREQNLELGEHLIVRQVWFNTNSYQPHIEFMTESSSEKGFQWRKKHIFQATHDEQLEEIDKVLLVTQYAPCTDCAENLARHLLREKLEIHMIELSRHKGQGSQPAVGIDSEYLNALAKLIKTGIPITFDDINRTQLVWKRYLQ